MTRYETAFILKPTLNEEERKTKIDLISNTLTKQGAAIEAVYEMGSRSLAYRINKFDRGYYVVIYFTADGKAIKELERIYKINEDFIRFIVVKYAKNIEIQAWENMVKRAKGEPHKETSFVEKPRVRKPLRKDAPQETKPEHSQEQAKEQPQEQAKEEENDK